MEWIRISKNKLKIMLSAEDARHYELDCKSADLGDLVTRSAFREILSDVKRQTDFDASEDKIYIQMYPSKEGGCEMYVTKLGEKSASEDKGEHIPDSHRLRPLPKRRMAYSFDSISSLVAVCKRLSGIGFAENSSAFRSHVEKDKYFLLIEEPEENAYLPLTEHSFICEYGKSENLKNTLLFIHEHTDPICQSRAVETLSRL